jgi:hypothetical protein
MKLNRDEFRKLQREWYQKLADLGFKDVEQLRGNELVLKQLDSQRYQAVSEFERETKEEYFRCMSQIAQDDQTFYKSPVDKLILIKHCEGAKIKTIMHELSKIGEHRNRASIRFIIRRYEMAWGMKVYTASELNKK